MPSYVTTYRDHRFCNLVKINLKLITKINTKCSDIYSTPVYPERGLEVYCSASVRDNSLSFDESAKQSVWQRHELRVTAQLGDPSAVEHGDLVCVLDCRQAMRYHHHCTSDHHPLQSLLHQMLALRVQSTAPTNIHTAKQRMQFGTIATVCSPYGDSRLRTWFSYCTLLQATVQWQCPARRLSQQNRTRHVTHHPINQWQLSPRRLGFRSSSYRNMTSSTNQEVRITYGTEPQASCTENLVKSGCLFLRYTSGQ